MGLTLLFVIAIAARAIAGPIQEVVVTDQCAKQCTVSSKFDYEIGQTYEFNYETELRTAIQGASEDQAGVDLSAKVYIDFLSKCEMVMRLSDVKLTEQDPETSTMKPVTSDLISGLEQNPMTVSFQDGNIEEICLSKPENDKILNIKRGIVSLIQNNMDDINKGQNVVESDVSGTCDTEYTSEDNGWYKKLIKKSKNLLGCTDRQGSNTAIQGIPYTSKSEFQSVPIIKSTHECQQEVMKSNGRLQSATCHEVHSFIPFSRSGSGATTHNTQTLTFVKEYKSSAKPEQISTRVPILFQHASGKSADDSRKDMEQKLMEICSSTKDGVTPETPKLFTSLVYSMKEMESTELAAIYQKINNKEICSVNNNRVRKFFLDAIPMAGTTDSLKLMVKILTSGQMTGIDADMWMTSLAFVQNPTIDMLAEVKPLLSMKTNQDKAMLSVSSLVHTVCKTNPNCDNSLEVKKIISLLESKIASSCKISDETFHTSLLAIRAIGNAGYGTGAIPTLTKCFKRTENPIEIRLSAIEAFRRIPCKADKLMILTVFMDTEEDSEIRIAAYKSMMECPTDYLISKVKAVLGKEEVNQVGSYVWSHLTNLMETSDPHKQTIRAILEDETLQKEFDLDNRKFSRNYEKSLFIERLNTGAVAEGDLIWSSKSFIPRSAMVNLTVDLFGNAINLFEIGGRVEGLEYFLESYFGPNGYFSEKDAQEAVDETAVDVIKSDKVNRIDKRNNRVMDELRGSLYMKVFGNELRYMNFNGLDSLLSQNNFNFLDMMMQLSNENNYQYTQSSMFMDSAMIVPTSSGFPLNLTVNGTATVDITASGKMDVMKLTTSPPTLDVHGIIRPSGALVVSSIMGIDALDTQIGIKMVSTLHSSTSVQGKVSLAEGSILDVEFDLPEEKQDIISVSSSFFTIHRHSEREQKMITNNRQEYNSCSGNKLAKITGLEICGELSFPNASLVENAPYFPLTGPVKAGLSLYKRDSSMTGYKMEARSTHNADENIIRLAFSTPNSKVDRSFAIDLNLNKAQGAFDASLTSPWIHTDFKGTFVNDNTNKGISGKLNHGGSVRFDVKANLQSERSGPGMLYTPIVQISIPGMNPVGLSGSIKYAPWKLFETDLSLKGIKDDPISVKTSIQNKAKIMSASASLTLSPKQIYSADSSMQITEYKKKVVYKSQISVRSPSQELVAFAGSYTNVYDKNIELDLVLDKIVDTPLILKTNLITKQYRRGRLQKILRVDFRSKVMDIKMKNKFDNRNGKTFATDTDLTYVIRRYARDNIKLVTKVINQSSKSLMKARASMNLASKRYPVANLKLMSNINHNKRHSEIDTDLAYGIDFKDINKQVSFSMSMDRAIKSFSQASATLNGKLLVGPDFRIITKLDHTHEPTSLNSNVMLRFNKDAVTSSLSLKNTSTDLKNLFGQLELELPGKSILVSQLIKENAPSDYTSTMNAKYGKYKHSIVTAWKKISPSSLTISSDIDISSVDPIKVEAEYNLGPEQYKIGGSLQKAALKYSTLLTSQVDMGKSFQISTDLESPTRHIVGNFETTKSGNKYNSRADVRWNADRDDTQRVTINGKGQILSLANVEGSFTVQYPSRTVAVNVKNSVGNKINSHIDFQWEPSKIVSFDSTFGDYSNQDSREIISNIKLRTPFTSLKVLDINLDHQIKNDIYQTKLDAEWNPKQILSATLTTKKPLTFRSIDIDFIGKAPSLGYKTIESSLKHSFGNGVSTIGKIALNRQSAQIDLSLSSKSDDSTTDVKGQIDIKTSFRQLRTATVTLSHKNTGRRIDSSALLKYNKMQYGVDGSVMGKMSGWELNTDGEISIQLPSNTIKTTWGHKNSLSEMTSTSEITWNNKRIFVSFNGLQDLALPAGTLSAALEIQTPFIALKDIVFQLNHLHKFGQIDSTLKISNNGNSLATIEGKYLRENGKVTSRFSASNPLYDGILSAELNAEYQRYPMTVHLTTSMTQLQTLMFDGSFNKNTNGDIDTALTITIPNEPTIELSASRQKQGPSINSAVTLKYKDDQTIRLESLHRIGAVKQLKLKFTSPYTEVYSAEGSFQKSSHSIRATANIEAKPFLSRWSVESSLDRSNGISGNFKVDTPYPTISYSQISVLSEMVDGSRQSSVVAEYAPGRIVKLTSNYIFKTYEDMQATMELSTPFTFLPHTSAAFRHQGDFSAFSNYGEIVYKSEKFSLESKFSMKNGIQSSITIKSPFTQDLSGSISHDGNINNFLSHGEVTWGKTVSVDVKHDGSLQRFSTSAKLSSDRSSYSGNINFNLGPKMVTDVSIDTPIANFENIRLSHSFEGKVTKFTNRAEVSTTGFGKISSDINADFENAISLTVSAQTPLRNFRDMKVVFTHEGIVSRFATHAELQNGLSLYSGDVKLNTDPAISFETVLKTPFKNFTMIRLSMTSEGAIDNFKLHIETQLNKDISEIDLISNIQKKYDIDLTIRSPYMDTIKASLDHWGSLKKFQSKLNVRSGKDKLLSSIKFAIKPTFNAVIAIKSPFAMLKNQQLSLKHAGSMNSFKCNMQYRCNGQTYIGDASFQNLNALQAELNLKGPTFRPINVAVSHDGTISNFKSSAAMSMGKKTIQADASFNSVNGIKGSVGLATPFDGYESMNAAISHAGEFNNFKSHGEVRCNRQSGQVDITVDATRDLSATITISTPFKGYTNIITSVKHTGTIDNFNTLATYSVSGKSIEGQASFQASPVLSGSASVKSSFSSIGNNDISFSHEGTLKKFNTNGEMNIANSKSIANIAFDSTHGYEGRISIDSPFMKKTDVEIKHTVTDDSMNTNAFFSQNDVKQYSIQSDLSRKPISGIVTITTPHDGLESTELSLHHEGTTNDFRSSISLDIFGGKYESEIALTPLPDMQASLTLRSPNYKDVEVNFAYQGRVTKFNSRFNALYGRESKMLLDTTLNIEGPFSGDFKIVSPLMKNMKASFSHDGGLHNFNSQAQVTYAGQTTDGSIVLQIRPDITATVHLSSPITKDLDINFAHYGPLTNCKSNGAISYGGQKHLNFDSQFSFTSKLISGIKITTTIPGYSEISAKVNHEGDLSAFQCNGEVSLEQKSASGELKYSPTEGNIKVSTPFSTDIDGTYKLSPNEGSIRLATPFTKNLQGNYKVNDKILNSKSYTSLSYGSKKLIGIRGDMNYPKSGDISLETPLEGLEISRFSLSRSGDFGGNLEIELNGVSHQGHISLDKNSRRMTGSASVNSPMIPKISSDISLSGTLSNFLSHFDFVFENNKHAIDSQFSMGNKIEGNISVKSSLIPELSANFGTNKDLANLESTADISLDSKKVFNIISTIENSNRKTLSLDVMILDNSLNFHSTFDGILTDFNGHVETSLNNVRSEADAGFSLKPLSMSASLKSPWTGPVKSALNLDGDFSNFKGHCEFSLNNIKNEGDVSFQLSPLRSDITIKSPKTNLAVSITHDGSLRNFKTAADANIDGQKMDIDVAFNIETAIEASASLNIPNMETMKGSFEHTNTENNVRNLMALEYGQSTWASSELSLSYKPIKASLSIKTPFDGYKTVSALFSHNGRMLDFNNHVEIIIEGRKSLGDMNFNFGSKLEGRISASSPFFPSVGLGFELSGNLAMFTTDADFSLGDEKYSLDASVDSRTGIDASLTIITPIQGYKTITAKLTHTGQYPTTTSIAQLKTGRRNLLTGSAQIDNTDGTSVTISLQSVLTPTVQANFKHTGIISNFDSNAELRINGNPSAVSIGLKTSPTVSGIMSLTTPYTNPVSGSFEIKSINKELSLHIEGSYDSKSLVGDAELEYGNIIGANVAVQSPFEGFENMKGSFKYIKENKGFSSNVDIDVSGKKIEVDAKSSWRQAMTGSLSISTPFVQLRRSSAEFTFDGTFPNVKTEMTVLHSGQKYYLNGAIDNSNGRIVINTPFQGFEVMRAAFNYEGTMDNLRTEATLNYMTGKQIFVSLQNTMTNDRLQTKAKLQTPYTDDLSFDLTFNGQLNDFSNTMAISMGEANSVTSTTVFKLSNASLDLETSLRSVLGGYADEQKLSLSYEGMLPNMKASANAKFLGSYFSIDSSLQADDTINGMIALRTPFDKVRDVAFNFDHAGSSRRFTTKTEVQYDTNKKIEGTLQYSKYGWRRLQTSLDIRTPFVGFEQSKASYRHTASVDSFECDSDISFMKQDFTGNLRASMSPLSVSAAASTPYAGFEQISADSKLAFGSGAFNVEANVQYMQGKTISISSSADITSSPQSANLKITTPFPGFENNEIILSNTGDLRNFQSTMTVSSPLTSSVRAQANMRYTSLKSMEGSITFTSQIKNIENLRLTLKNEAIIGKYNSKIDMSWAPSKTITFDGSFTDSRTAMTADMTLATPFESMRQLNLKSETSYRGTVYSQSLYGKLNGKTLADIDFSGNTGIRKSATMVMRSPKTLSIELEGSMESTYEGSLSLSLENRNNLKINGQFDPRTNAFSIKYTCPENSLSLDGRLSKSNTKLDFVMNGNHYGYDMTITGTEGQAKVILPSRSLKLSASKSDSTTEGSFMWDADRDETRKIGFRSVLRPSSDSLKADVTLMLPSIGKEVQIDSQMSLNKGQILFDGKTELTYSRDSRKKFTIMSRLEDISNSWNAKNYSFTFGISHPYTSVDVQVSSQFGNSNQKITGSLNMNYLTVKKDVKTFAVKGEVDKVRNAFSLDMDTPMKKIGINGNAQRVSPYRLSITNKYDAKRPLNTVFSFDPSKRSIDFQMNYDLENPSSEFHMSAKYVNSSAVAAEMFHVVNRQRVTDALLALRLNSSSLLHSRIHWRPDMISDLKALSDRKINSYERRLRNFANLALDNMGYELKQKAILVWQSVSEEAEPVTAIAKENLRKLSEMYETNEYHIRDMTDAVLLKLSNMEEMSEEYIRFAKERIGQIQLKCTQMCKDIKETLIKFEDATGSIVLKSVEFYRKNADHAYNISRPMIQTVNDKYNNYVQYMNQINVSPVSSMAETYTSAIYGAHDIVSSRLSTLLGRDDVKYFKSISDRVYQQGHNAYKYWELRENTEMVGKAVADWIRQEIEKEISDIKAIVMNLMKSEVTVYDPKNGEIQMEFHLPIPLKSLDVIPKVDYMPFVTKAKSYIPKMPSLSLPSTDVRTWLPPFDAIATVQGNKITTFDGLTYDVDNSCTFMLARDFVNSNFSVVLHRDGDNKTMAIVNGQNSIKIFSDGKVSVNGMPVDQPAIIKDITVTALDGHLAVSVAGHLNVDYYKDLDTYILKLNGYYYGKTSGLLGTYDNEPSNDLMTSFGKVTSSAERFAKTWDVGTERCR